MSSQWYLIDALGRTETPVKAATDMDTVRFYSPRLHSRWTGDPRETPALDSRNLLIEKIWSGEMDGRLAELDPILRGDGVDSFRLEQIRLRAGLTEGDLPREKMNLPLTSWPREILELVVSVLLEIGIETR
jgi:hypothetical protein